VEAATFSWPAVVGAAEYSYWVQVNDEPASLVTTTTATVVTVSAVPGDTIRFAVRAVNASGPGFESEPVVSYPMTVVIGLRKGGRYVEGSEFALYADSDLTEQMPDAIVRTNSWEITVLPGTYYLVQTRAPQGASLLPAAIQFEITPEGVLQLAVNEMVGLSLEDYLQTIIVTNQPWNAGFVLPATGGTDYSPHMLIGFAILAVGVVSGLWWRREQVAAAARK